MKYLILSLALCAPLSYAQTQSRVPIDVYEVDRAKCLSGDTEKDTGECLRDAQAVYERNRAQNADNVFTCADVDIKDRAVCELQDSVLRPNIVSPMISPVLITN